MNYAYNLRVVMAVAVATLGVYVGSWKRRYDEGAYLLVLSLVVMP